MQSKMDSSPFPRIGHGIGLRPKHWNHVLQTKPDVDWFEVITENFMDTEGTGLRTLEKIRKDYPVVTHGVALSIGSADPLDPKYLKKLKKLVDHIEPVWFSDHLCWTSINKVHSYDLLPLPQTEKVIMHIADRIDQVQNYVGKKMLIENVSSYVTFKDSDVSEWEFISEIARKSGCGILLDINNIYVNAFNHDFSAETYIQSIPTEYVAQFHLAGHTDFGTYLFDTHSARMIDATWKLYELAVRRFGNIPTLVEWDEGIPDFDVLVDERKKAVEIEKHAMA